MLVLSAFAILLIWGFHADVNRLIQLYVVGVFTAFTLSQTGMVRHWHKVSKEGGPKAEGWRWRLITNAAGAVATGIVLIIVVITKFREGAWIVITAIPILIAGFYAVHRHYTRLAGELRSGTVVIDDTVRNTVVVVVEGLNAATAEAIGYVRSFRGNDFRAVAVSDDPELATGWHRFCGTTVPLEVIPPTGGSKVTALVKFAKHIPREGNDFVTLVLPELLVKRGMLSTLRRRRAYFLLKLRLLSVPQLVVADVPVMGATGQAGTETRPLIPQRTEAIVLVSAVHDGTIQAINYARSLRCTETRALFVALDPAEVEPITRAWEENHIPVELDVVEAPFRELGIPIQEEVRRVTARSDSVAAVVIPEIVVSRWWHHFLHGQRALFLKRLLLFEERVILSSVPYQVS
jgi:hypothetical protein